MVLTLVEGGRGKSALRLHHQLGTDTVAPLLSLPPASPTVLAEQKVDNVCAALLLLFAHMFAQLLLFFFFFTSLPLGHLSLMTIGVSAELAGDGLFMAFLMRAIIQTSQGTRDLLYNR